MEKEHWNQRMRLEIGIVKGSLSSMNDHLAKGRNRHFISNIQYETLAALSENSERNLLKIYQLMHQL